MRGGGEGEAGKSGRPSSAPKKAVETWVLGFHVDAVRQVDYLIPKTPSNSRIGWFWDQCPLSG